MRKTLKETIAAIFCLTATISCENDEVNEIINSIEVYQTDSIEDHRKKLKIEESTVLIQNSYVVDTCWISTQGDDCGCAEDHEEEKTTNTRNSDQGDDTGDAEDGDEDN